MNRTSKKCGRISKYVTYIIGISEEEWGNEVEKKIFEVKSLRIFQNEGWTQNHVFRRLRE